MDSQETTTGLPGNLLLTDGAVHVTVGGGVNGEVAITGQTLEAGGSGIIGWLSSLRKAITDRLPAALGTGGGIKVDGSGTALPTSDAGPGAGAGVMQAPQHGDMSAGTTQLVAAAGIGLKWVVTDIIIGATAACEVSIIDDEGSNVLVGPLPMSANTSQQFTPRSKTKQGTANKKLYGKSSTADHVTIQVGVVSEA